MNYLEEYLDELRSVYNPYEGWSREVHEPYYDYDLDMSAEEMTPASGVSVQDADIEF